MRTARAEACSSLGRICSLMKRRGEPAELEVGDEVVAALAGAVNGLDRADGPQRLQALARGAQADVEPAHELLHREGCGETKSRP